MAYHGLSNCAFDFGPVYIVFLVEQWEEFNHPFFKYVRSYECVHTLCGKSVLLNCFQIELNNQTSVRCTFGWTMGGAQLCKHSFFKCFRFFSSIDQLPHSKEVEPFWKRVLWDRMCMRLHLNSSRVLHISFFFSSLLLENRYHLNRPFWTGKKHNFVLIHWFKDGKKKVFFCLFEKYFQIVSVFKQTNGSLIIS